MPDSGVNDDWLIFCPQIKVISMIEEYCLNIVIRNIFQGILAMDILKNSNSNVSSVSLSNMIKVRLIVPPVAHFIEMMKWHQINNKILAKDNIIKSYKSLIN